MITLKAHERQFVPVRGRYLIVRYAERPVLIEDAISGVAETEIRTADNVELDGVQSLAVINPHDVAVKVDVHTSPFKILTNDGGSVTVQGGSLDRINESIEVTATATVENGTMHVLSGSGLSTSADKVVASGATVKLASANANRKALLVQVLSDTTTAVRLGGANVAANRGVYVSGSKAAPASIPMEVSAELFVHNLSDAPARLSVLEVMK